MPRLLRLGAATIAALAIAPAAAHAGTISLENGTLTFRGTGAEGNNLLVSTYNDWETGKDLMAFRDGRPITILSGPCTQADPTTVHCTQDASRPLLIEGSQGNDSISLFDKESVPDSVPVTIRGLGGDDTIKDTYDGAAGRTLEGGPGNDNILGYDGPDVIDGGDGNDTVDGGAGADTVRAGAGDDILWGDHYAAAAADVLDGGPGTDVLEEWSIPTGSVHPPATVSQDGLANDGRPGEGDNVTGIERFTQRVTTTFIGSDADERVEVLNLSELTPSTLSGGGGNDWLVAYDADDKVDGGPGDDHLEGGMGHDVITGGPGKDVIMGDTSGAYCGYYTCKIPYGNDTINARDGEVDQIDCGVGEDTVIADTIDVVAANCEKVDRAAGAAAPAPAGPGGGKGGAGSSGLKVSGALTRKALLGGTLKLAVPCPAACSITVTGKVDKRTAKRLRLRSTTVATGKATRLAGGTAGVKVKAATKARKALRRKGRVKVSFSVAVKSANGKVQRSSASVTLK